MFSDTVGQFYFDLVCPDITGETSFGFLTSKFPDTTCATTSFSKMKGFLLATKLFYFSLNTAHTDLRVNSLGSPLLGRLATECFPRVINVFPCRMMESKLFGNGLMTFPRLMARNNCFPKNCAAGFRV